MTANNNTISVVLLCFLASIISSVVTAETSIRSTSRAGQLLLQKAQRVLNENNNNNNNADYSYIAEYSIKFQGCHHVQQWNDNVDEDNDVRIMTKRLARFRLCPTDQCSNDKSSGCSTKYGDYVVDVRRQYCIYCTGLLLFCVVFVYVCVCQYNDNGALH